MDTPNDTSSVPAETYELEISLSQFTDDANLIPLYLQRFDRPHTRRSYRSDLSAFFDSDYVDLELARQASFLYVNQHIEELQEQGRKASTIRRRVAAIRGFYDWLLALEAVERNPADKNLIRKVRTPNRRDQSITFLTKAQAEQLIEATAWVWRKKGNEQVKQPNPAHLRDRALIMTLLHCVLRRSEAADMDVRHIRPLGHYWVVDLPTTKGGTGQYVKMPARVVEAVDEMRAHFEIESGPLWRSTSNRNRGDRLTPDSIYKMVKRTAARAELPDVGAHTLRHTGCTLAIDSGASIQQVQTHARHKDIDTTMTYVHQRDKLRDSAADYIHLDD